MSKETYEALEQAIRDHLLDDMPDTFLSDWCLMTASATADASRTRYFAEYSDSPHHTLLGLTLYSHQDVIRQEAEQQ